MSDYRHCYCDLPNGYNLLYILISEKLRMIIAFVIYVIGMGLNIILFSH